MSKQKKIIQTMMGKEALTIAELSEASSISVPIVTKLVYELSNVGKLLKIDSQSLNRSGRPAVRFKLNPSAGYTIGVDLGRIYTNYIILDYSQRKVYEHHRKSLLTMSLSKSMKQLKADISQLLTQIGITKKDLLGIGFSLPGMVQGKLGTSHTYFRLDKENIGEYLEREFGVTIRLEHDVKSMTLGEQFYGSANGVDNAIFLNYGWGVGIGIIIDGKLYYGNDGYAGEFGHIQIIPGGELCYCGKNGCLETLSSGRSITKKVREQLSSGASSLLLKTFDDIAQIQAPDILNAANNGDQFSIEILEEAGNFLGVGIGTLINIFNPQKIIIGGTFSNVAGYLLNSVKNSAMKHSLVELNNNVIFEISNFSNSAGALGIARLTAMENCLTHGKK